MRRLFLVLLPLVAAGPALAAGCTTDVVAAFEKQRTSKAFRVEFSQPTAEGEAQMRIDYIPPDKMLQTVTSPAIPSRRPGLFGDERHFRRTTAPIYAVDCRRGENCTRTHATKAGQLRMSWAHEVRQSRPRCVPDG